MAVCMLPFCEWSPDGHNIQTRNSPGGLGANRVLAVQLAAPTARWPARPAAAAQATAGLWRLQACCRPVSRLRGRIYHSEAVASWAKWLTSSSGMSHCQSWLLHRRCTPIVVLATALPGSRRHLSAGRGARLVAAPAGARAAWRSPVLLQWRRRLKRHLQAAAPDAEPVRQATALKHQCGCQEQTVIIAAGLHHQTTKERASLKTAVGCLT
jgi:hypothetical protein